MINRYGYKVRKLPAAAISELGIEVYNPHEETIYFDLKVSHPLYQSTVMTFEEALAWYRSVPEFAPHLQELRKICKPDGYAYLPFGIANYQTRWERSGSPYEGITCLVILGKDIGTGKKPTRDEILAIRRGQRRVTQVREKIN